MLNFIHMCCKTCRSEIYFAIGPAKKTSRCVLQLIRGASYFRSINGMVHLSTSEAWFLENLVFRLQVVE